MNQLLRTLTGALLLVAATAIPATTRAADEVGDEPPLFSVIADNNILRVVELIEDIPARRDQPDSHGTTPLEFAIKRNRPEIAKLLLVRGANGVCPAGQPDRPMQAALEQNDIATVQALLAHGDHPNGVSEPGKSLLQVAYEANCYDGFVALLDAGADAKVASKYGGSLLSYITDGPRAQTTRPWLDYARALIAHHADPNAPGQFKNFPPLCMAAWEQKTDQIEFYLAAGADPNRVDPLGSPVLDGVIRTGRVDLVKRCLELGADPNAGCRQCESPLGCVLEFSATGQSFAHITPTAAYQMIELLLAHGADPAHQPAAGFPWRPPLIFAVQDHDPEFADLLIAHGADPFQRFSNGVCPLSWADPPIRQSLYHRYVLVTPPTLALLWLLLLLTAAVLLIKTIRPLNPDQPFAAAESSPIARAAAGLPPTAARPSPTSPASPPPPTSSAATSAGTSASTPDELAAPNDPNAPADERPTLHRLQTRLQRLRRLCWLPFLSWIFLAALYLIDPLLRTAYRPDIVLLFEAGLSTLAVVGIVQLRRRAAATFALIGTLPLSYITWLWFDRWHWGFWSLDVGWGMIAMAIGHAVLVVTLAVLVFRIRRNQSQLDYWASVWRKRHDLTATPLTPADLTDIDHAPGWDQADRRS